MHSTKDKNYFRRLQAIELLLEGLERHVVLRAALVTTKTLTRWVNAYNEGGIDALATKRKPGRPPLISNETFEKFRPHLDPSHDSGIEVWTAKMVHGYLIHELKVQCGYSTVTHTLHRNNYAVKTPRSWPAKQNQKDRNNYRWTMEQLQKRTDIDIWFCDESGFLADPRPCRRWAEKGTTPTTPTTGLHIRANVVAAVNPVNGELHALVFDRMEKQRFQKFIDELAKHTKDRKTILVLDNATWHKAALNWRHIQPLLLPTYSPDLNPIERLWRVMKDRYFNNWYTDNYETLEERVCTALKKMMKNEPEVASICRVA
ncbi:IS630 family transposase [bacterium]|nr:IS630 family transposase [bacterium]